MRDSGSALGRVLGNRLLRRVELAFALFALAEYGVWLAIMVYAFQHGGTTTAALVAALQLVPAAAVAPLAARVTDRRGGAEMLLAGYILQTVSAAAIAAVILMTGPAPLVYAGAVVLTSAVTLTRPAQAKLLAAQVDLPAELTAATVVTGWADSLALLGGPALAGALIGLGSVGLAVTIFTVGLLVAAALVAPAARASLRAPLAAREVDIGRIPAGTRPPARDGPRVSLWAHRPSLALLWPVAAQYVALGALDVLVVVLAVRTLHLGAPVAGYLAAAFGAGGVAGAALAVGLVGAPSLVRPLFVATATWAVAFVLLGSFPSAAGAVAFLIMAGLSRSLVDTSARALLARVTPLSRLGQMFGLLEGMNTLALAVGALLVPALVALGSVRLALIGVAVLLSASVILPRGYLLLADRSAPAADGLARLHGHPLFARLSLPALEELARDMITVRVPAGRHVLREGEPGDRFYLIADGELDVSIVGEHIRTLHSGDGFGEIALLRDVPRTATVCARTDAVIYGLERRPFLTAMGSGGS